MKPRYQFLFKTERGQMDAILQKVCDYYYLPTKHIFGFYRGSNPLVEAKHLAMFAMRMQMDSSLWAIACYFEKDHTTVMNAIKRVIKSEKLLNKYATIFDTGKTVDKTGIAVYKLSTKDCSSKSSKTHTTLSPSYAKESGRGA